MGCGLGVTQRYTEKREIHGGLWVMGCGLGVTQRYTEKKEIHGGLWVAGYGLRVVGWELHRDTLRVAVSGCGLQVVENS